MANNVRIECILDKKLKSSANLLGELYLLKNKIKKFVRINEKNIEYQS